MGGRRVAGNELISIAESCDFSNPATFLASGNLVFDTSQGPEVQRILEEALRRNLGYEVPVMLRTADQVRTIAASTMYDAQRLKASSGKIQVSLLMTEPTQQQVEETLLLSNADDALAMRGQELYWLPSGNMSDSELNNAAIDKILGMRTTRTMNTVQRLSKKFLIQDSK